MKLSAGTVGTVLFTAAGIAVFVLMAKRTPMDGAENSAMNFGMPTSEALVEEKMPEAPEATMPEAAAPTTMSTETTPAPTPEATTLNMPATSEVEPVKTEETAIIPTTPEVTIPPSKELEMEIEEMLKNNKPADIPSVEGAIEETIPAN